MTTTFRASISLEELMQEARWCCWRRMSQQDSAGTWRPKKIPYMANRQPAKSNDPTTWADYQTVKAAHDADPDYFTGVGVFFGDDLCGIDIDAHDGGENALAAEVLDMFKGTYIERSPSGTGYHILFTSKYTPTRMIVKYDKDGGNPQIEHKLDDRYKLKNDSNGLEFYSGEVTNRFFTFTGNRVSEGDAITEQSTQLALFLEKYMRNDKEKPRPDDGGGGEHTTHTRVQQSFDMTKLTQRLDLARKAKNGDKFSALYDRGDTTEYSGNHSDADQALCAMLAFWLDADPTAVDAAFRASALMRPKWDERHNAKMETYGEMTVSKAVETVPYGETYKDDDTGTLAVLNNPTFGYQYMPTNAGDLTDAGNAEKFSELYRHKLCYCNSIGWLEWTGKVWKNDEHAANRCGLEYSENMLTEALAAFNDAVKGHGDEKAARAYLVHAKRTRSTAGIVHFTELAKARLAVPLEKLDADPYALNTEAGIIDLHTGVCRGHDPEAYCTKITPYTPSYENKGMWLDYLKLITSWAENQQEIMNYLQLVMGQSIIGNEGVGEESLRIMYGDGGNGKSTFFNAIQAVIGEYGTVTTPSMLIEDNRINRDNYMSQLVGRRLVTCGELEEGQRLSISQLKHIASREAVTVRLMRQNPEKVTPSWHVFLHTNFLPRVGSADTGTWRRLIIVPFKAKMPTGTEKVLNYDHELVEKAGGAILQWLIDGAKACVAAGGKIDDNIIPDDVKRATDAYREREDLLQQFLVECCVFDDSAKTSKADLYQAYKQFTTQNNAYTLKSVDFGEAMKRRFTTTTVHGTIMFHGVKIIQNDNTKGGALEWNDTISKE